MNTPAERTMSRNLAMAERIGSGAAGEPLRFVIAGDSGAWPDPTAEAIFRALVDQIARLEPVPAFFANLGDFAGPGTMERHADYLRSVEPLPMPNICVVGNHDLDDESGPEAFVQVHGPMNFDFACGHTRFVSIHGEGGIT